MNNQSKLEIQINIYLARTSLTFNIQLTIWHLPLIENYAVQYDQEIEAVQQTDCLENTLNFKYKVVSINRT